MKFYDSVRHRLGVRQRGFDFAFRTLQTVEQSFIVETGCARVANNYEGDGLSSLLWDAYINEYGGLLHTVDLSPDSVRFCKHHVSDKSVVIHSDSITYLKTLNEELQEKNKKIDFLYLDSFDAPKKEPDIWRKSALHHLYEFLTIRPSLKKVALIGVDDNWLEQGAPAGKGTMILDYMNQIKNPPVFAEYQLFWIL